MDIRGKLSVSHPRGPNVIGATGGSGTRVVARIVRRGGMFIGETVTSAEDAADLGAYSDRWINPFHRLRFSDDARGLDQQMRQDLAAVIRDHLGGARDEPVSWGWKEPRSILLLPFFFRVFPELSFLHVIRDGRDMACSGNQNQLRKHGRVVLGNRGLHWPTAVRSIAMWSRVNTFAADFGQRMLGPRYLRIRFEDLCRHPAETVAEILRFLSLEGAPEAIGCTEVDPPGSLGRWQDLDPHTQAQLERVGASALKRFGYL